MNDFVIANLVDLFVLNRHFLLSSFHWNIWLEQSSQIWKDLFLLNLRNSTIPKVFISEIVNFPSFHIQTFHISCTQPHFTPALSDTLFTLNHTTSRQNGPPSETFYMQNISQHYSFSAGKWNNDFVLWIVFHNWSFLLANGIFSLKENSRNLWTKINKT